MRKLKALSMSLSVALLAATGQAFAARDYRQGALFDASIKHQPADGVVRLYGPGGPHTGLIKVAEAFQKKTGKKVEVNFGPESKWSKQAQARADIIFGSSEQSMSAYLENYRFVTQKDVQPLYLRRAVMVVKKGNPKKIRNFGDLTRPGVKVVVTEGKGVYNTSGTGLWEDIAGRTGELKNVQDLYKNIVAFSKGSGAAFGAFNKQGDAWITWIDWALSNMSKVDYVDFGKNRVIYRDMSIAVSPKADPATKEFVAFLNGSEGAKIMGTLGWTK